jgi:hypothetical protein
MYDDAVGGFYLGYKPIAGEMQTHISRFTAVSSGQCIEREPGMGTNLRRCEFGLALLPAYNFKSSRNSDAGFTPVTSR